MITRHLPRPSRTHCGHRALLSTLIGISLLFLPGFAIAESSLTSKQVDRFLDSLPDVEALGEKYGNDARAEGRKQQDKANRRMPHGAAGIAGFGANGVPTIPSAETFERAASPFSSNLDEMRASEGFGEMVSTVKKHGFASVEEWASVGDRSMRAFASSKMSKEMPKMNAEMAKARKSLAESGMPKAQQEAMLKMMDSSSQTMKAFEDVPEADIQAVAPHLERFEALGRDSGSPR